MALITDHKVVKYRAGNIAKNAGKPMRVIVANGFERCKWCLTYREPESSIVELTKQIKLLRTEVERLSATLTREGNRHE